jgi:3-deoxy-D-manno-octulosonate 8-phosphate phosphatase KdsC-like HAD superfamily phosphatase
LVEETELICQRLDEKLYNQTSQKKQQTVVNIHVQQRPIEGSMIFIGDDNWNLVLNMMIGLQMAVRSVRGYQEMIYE